MTVRLSLAILVVPVWMPLLAPVTWMNCDKLVTTEGETSLKRTSTNWVCAGVYSAPGKGDKYR